MCALRAGFELTPSDQCYYALSSHYTHSATENTEKIYIRYFVTKEDIDLIS